MRTEGEKIATLEANMINIDRRLTSIEESVASLHGKYDAFMKIITESYVAKETFEEYKRNRTLERIITILATATISGLVAFFLREFNV